MKSAAFNLAFKVHRNDLAFPEGLLKAYDENAHQDFIEALNSLAGEQKYDVHSIETLVDEARQSIESGGKEPQVDIASLQEEINQLQEKINDHKESIQRIHNQNAALKPKVIPGLNSVLLGLVGLVITMIVFLLGITILGLLCLVGTLIVIGLTLFQDLEALKKEKEAIARKVERNLMDIQQLEALIEEIRPNLEKKTELLNTVTQNQ